MQNEKIVSELKALKKAGIEYDKQAREYKDVQVSPTVIERDGKILVSAEDGLLWADYYGEFSGGYPIIDKALEDFAKARGMFWEWENPGAIYLCE
jgi:hypothetical protein